MMKVTICSSIEFSPQIISIKKELEKMEYKVNIPYGTQKMLEGEISYEEFMASKEQNWGDTAFREKESVNLIQRYWNFIKDSDAILVLNLEKKGLSNYIGWNTLMEMGFAYGHGKKIFLYNPIPEKSERIHYVDEIRDMKPIIIYGDLSQIK